MSSPTESSEESGSWHPSFPEIPAGAMRVSVGFEDGLDPAAWARKIRSRPLTASWWIWIVGPPGSGRRSLARALHAALSSVPGLSVPGLLLEPPPEGWSERRRRRPETTIAVCDGPRPARPARLDQVLRPAPWGPDAIRGLADALRPHLSAEAGARCVDFSARCLENPALLGPTLGADLAIRLLAQIAAGDIDGAAEPDALHRQRTAAAWARVSGSLEALDEALMERLWSTRLLQAEGLDWTEADRGAIAAALEEAAHTYGSPDQLEAMTLLERLGDAGRRKDRQALLEQLRLHMATRSGERILQALLLSGLLEVRGEHVAATDRALAMLWAARGLSEQRWSLTPRRAAHPAWAEAARALGNQGLPPRRWMAAVEGLPETAAPAAAQLTLLFAETSAASLPLAELQQAWADCAWGTICGLYPDPGEQARVTAALRSLSWRCRDALPALDPEDRIGDLRARVSALTRVRGVDPADVDHANALVAADRLLISIAPAQCVPVEPEDWEVWLEEVTERRDALLGWAASADRGAARSLLSGSEIHWEKRGEQDLWWERWSHLPAALRLRWLGRHEDDRSHLMERFQVLIRDLSRPPTDASPEWLPEDRGHLDALIEAARRLEPGALREALLHDLCPFSESRPKLLNPAFALLLAERLEIREVLEAVIQWPQRWLERVRFGWDSGPALWDADEEKSYPVEIWEEGERTAQLNRIVLLQGALWRPLTRLEARAAQAAEALYRAGSPEEIYRRWRAGSGWTLPEQLLLDARRVCSFFHALEEVGLARLSRNPAPEAVCKVLIGTCPESRRHQLVSYNRVRCRIVGELRGWDRDQLPEGIRLAVEALLCLRHRQWVNLVPELSEWIEQLSAMPVLQVSRNIESSETQSYQSAYDPGLEQRIAEGARSQALERLIAEQDEIVLRTWGEREVEPTYWRGGEQRAAADADERSWRWLDRALSRRFRREPELLDAAWRQNPRAAQRERLLLLGAHMTPPRPWVIRHARAASPMLRARIARRSAGDPASAPLLRRMVREARGRRDRRESLAWALWLRPHAPEAKEVREEILYWLLESPDPFIPIGAPGWPQGIRPMIELLDAPPAWLTPEIQLEGLERLWQLGLRLPIKRRYRPGSELPPSERLPWPLTEIVRLLEGDGAIEPLLAPWRSPPPDQPADAEVPVERAALVRAWLGPWWERWAGLDERRQLLRDGDPRSPSIAWELADYGEPAAAAWAMRRLAEPGTLKGAELAAAIEALALVAPEELPAAAAGVEAEAPWLRPALRGALERVMPWLGEETLVIRTMLLTSPGAPPASRGLATVAPAPDEPAAIPPLMSLEDVETGDLDEIDAEGAAEE